jgi:hypothetical protein
MLDNKIVPGLHTGQASGTVVTTLYLRRNFTKRPNELEYLSRTGLSSLV